MTDLALWLLLATAVVTVVVLAKRLLRLIQIDRTTDYWITTITQAVLEREASLTGERQGSRYR